MRGLARHEGAPLEALRGAARRAMENLVSLAISEGVEFVVIAGDLYDGDRDDYNTAVFLQRQLRVLGEAGIDVVIALGNHDAANEITKRLKLPSNVRVFSHQQPESIILEAAGVALHGQSYASRAVVEDLSANYPAAIANYLNVGVLHTSLNGRPNHERYAPCTADELADRGYDYWALGHVHQREVLKRQSSYLVFPGNLQGRDVGETGSKGATLVEYSLSGIQELRHVELAPIRWEVVEVDLGASSSVDDVIVAASLALAERSEATSAELLAARLEISAHTKLAEAWSRDAPRHEAQLRADANGASESLWIEKIKLKVVAGRSFAHEGEAIEAIRNAIAALRAQPSDSGEFSAIFAPLRAKLGSEFEEIMRLSDGVLDPNGAGALLDDVESLLFGELEGPL